MRPTVYFWLCIFGFATSACTASISLPTAEVVPVPNTQNPNASPAPAKIPVTWASLNITGKLIYNAADSTTGRVSVRSLDLTTGEVLTIFQVPQRGWVDAVAVSPDHKTLILSYSPPMEAPYGGQGSIYSMPLDGSKPPQLIVTPGNNQDLFFQPAWSPDGKYLYFAHINYESMTAYEIMRMAYPNGKPEKLISQAYWPRVSEDNTLLVYTGIDPKSGANQLTYANLDGTDARRVPLNGLPVPAVIDTPMFTPDNQTILFSSPVGIKAFTPNWLDKLLGVQIALADGSLPSDWWSVPRAGGTPKQLTNIQSLALYGVFSPDHRHIASYSTDGIFVMKPDGSELTVVVPDVGGIPGAVSWIP